MINPINFSIPALVITIGISFFSSGSNVVPGSAHWEQGEFVYLTQEDAFFDCEIDGVAYFITTSGDLDGEVWGCYIYDTGLQDGQDVVLTFENRITKPEYDMAAEYGIETTTRIDSARIIAIDEK